MPTEELDRRRAIWRLSLGSAAAFLLAQWIAWPLAYVAPVFAVILLTQPGFSLRQGAVLMLEAALGLLLGLAVINFLFPYPLIAGISLVLLLFGNFLFLLRGGPLVVFVFYLVGIVVLPIVGAQTLDLQIIPGVAAGGLWVGLGLGVVIAIIMLGLFPPTEEVEASEGPLGPASDGLRSLAVNTTLVVAVLLLISHLMKSDLVLMLIFAALLALGAARENDLQACRRYIALNFLGGLGAILLYQILVAAPFNLLLVVLVLAASLLFAERILSGQPSAKHWLSAFMGFLIIFGGALGSAGADADVKTLDRVLQIALAGAYVYFAFSVIDLSRALWRRIPLGSNSL